MKFGYLVIQDVRHALMDNTYKIPHVQQHVNVELMEMMKQIHVMLVATLVNVALQQVMTIVPNVTIILIGMKDLALNSAQMDIIKMMKITLVRDATDLA